MSTNESAPTDLMILRAWIEPNHKSPLRVRIVRLGMGDTDHAITSAVATVDDVCAAVRAWLGEVMGRETP